MAWKYVSLSPPPPPPDSVNFSAAITKFQRAPGSYSTDVRLLVTFDATAHNAWDWAGWETRLSIVMGAYSDSDSQNHTGASGGRIQELALGAVAPGNYTATVKLEAKGILGQWELLDTKSYQVTVLAEPPPPPPPPPDGDEDEETPEEKKERYLRYALYGGIGLAALGAIMIASSEKKSS